MEDGLLWDIWGYRATPPEITRAVRSFNKDLRTGALARPAAHVASSHLELWLWADQVALVTWGFAAGTQNDKNKLQSRKRTRTAARKHIQRYHTQQCVPRRFMEPARSCPVTRDVDGPSGACVGSTPERIPHGTAENQRQICRWDSGHGTQLAELFCFVSLFCLG